MAEKKRKYLKVAAEAVADIATMGTYGIAKRAGSQMLCERKGGKWVKGECIPKSQIRTGRKKHPSTPSKRNK